MTQFRLQTLTRAELLDEVARLGHQMDSAELDALMALGVLPFVETDSGDHFPMAALIQFVDALDAGAPLVIDELKERCHIFLDAMDGVANGLASAHRELRQLLSERAVLGELHRMLPVMEAGALETLRGDARLEWRLRMSLAEIGRLLAADRFRDEAMTPVRAPSITTDGCEAPPTREPSVTTRSGTAVIPRLLSKTESPANREAVDSMMEPESRPPAPGVGPHQVYEDEKSPIETGVRMPFLRDRDLDSDASVLVRPRVADDSAADGSDFEADSDHEDTEPFVSELSASRIAAFAEHVEPAGEKSPESNRLEDAHRRARRRWSDADPPTLQLETPTSSPLTAADAWEEGPTTTSEADPMLRPGFANTSESQPLQVRPSATGDFSTPDPGAEPRFPQTAQELDARRPSPRAREEAVVRSRPPSSGRPRYEAPEREADRSIACRQADAEADSGEVHDPLDDSVSSFLEQGFGPPLVEPHPAADRAEARTDLHMATSDANGRSYQRSRHPDRLEETAGPRRAARASDLRVELPVRRHATGDGGVDIQTVVSDPHAAYKRSAARLEKNGDDTRAQEELLAIVGGNDRKLARQAWATVAPYLRQRHGRSEALFGGLVMMSARDPDPAVRVRHLREAAGVAESVLGDHKRAFELFSDAIALAPTEELLIDRAETLAEAFGWWPEYVERLVDSSLDVGEEERRIQLTLLAGTAAREKVKDVELAIGIYEKIVADGVYDEDVVAALIDVYTSNGRSEDTLVLLLRCAGLADGVERIERLTLAADLCVEELNDLERALKIYEAALDKGEQSSEIRPRYVSLARRAGQETRAIAFFGAHESDAYANAMVRAESARTDFENTALEIEALGEAFAVSGGGEKLRAGFALADAQRKEGRQADEVRTLEKMLADIGSGESRDSVVRRLAGVLAAQDGGKEQAIEYYTQSIRAGEFDEQLVHALVSLLREDVRTDDVLDTLVLAAQNSKALEERLTYYRQVARTAMESIDDDEQALGLIEQMVDASDGDAEVLVHMATRLRNAGDDLSEMAALEQAVHQDAISVDPAVLMRLAELELARPRGAARAAELIERVLDLAPLGEDVTDVVGRVMPAVVDGTGRRDLDLRWTWSQAESVDNEPEAFAVWRRVVALQESVGDKPERRLHAVEAALAAADGVDAAERDRAELQLSMARVKRVMGHWNVAVEHAREAASYFLRVDPAGFEALEAVASVAELTQYVIDERPALRLLREAAETGEPPLMAAYAEALMHKGRWHEALPVLEELVAGATDPEMLERLKSELQRARTEASV